MSRSRHDDRTDIVARTLARNRLGVPAVVFFVLAAAAPLTVVAGGATTGWAVTGVIGIPVAYLAVAAVLAVFSVGYTAMSRRIVNSGAFYSYIAQGLGRVPGVGAAFVAQLAYNTMQIGLYGGFGVVLAGLLDDRAGIDLPWWCCAFAAWAVIGVLGVLRVDVNGRVLAVLLVAEIAVAVVYGAVAVTHPAGGTITFDTLAPSWLLDTGIGAGLATAIAGFVGFEATAVYAEETKDPRRTVPRATYLALLVIGLLYAASSWAMSVATGPAGIVDRAKADGTELMFTIVAPYLHRAWLDVGHVLFVTSLFAALLAFHNTVARYSFALGRERVLPAWLGATSARTNAPVWGSLTQTAVAGVVLAVYSVNGLDPILYLFFWWTVLGGLGVLVLMTATSVAVVAFFAHPGNRTGTGLWSRAIAPGVAAAALTYVLWLTLTQFDVLLGVTDPASPWPVVLPALYGAAAVLGMAWALLLRARSPQRYATIGLGADSAIAMSFTTPMRVGGVAR
ncbi:APC family permease [Dactylosporangium fulvum]|uniref:APC family permease n=1 Tax=Dactylosporangium fulvum TaxID=53359 RepID=A0ABY5VST9_9ACTN|nr:APC family permease [Dactylosporangium fulvum]UWP80822.1 APC family permease [Dactylosporangium fulvum]